MRTLDLIFAWLLFCLGAVHSFFTFRSFSMVMMTGVWFFGGGVAMMLAGLLNALRAQERRATGLLRFASIFANACMVIMALAITSLVVHHLSASPQVPLFLVLSGLELVFSIRGGN